jgi:hypothetical protein
MGASTPFAWKPLPFPLWLHPARSSIVQRDMHVPHGFDQTGLADRCPSHQLNSIFHHGALIYLDAGGVTRLLGALLNFAVYGPDAMIDPIHTMPYN